MEAPPAAAYDWTAVDKVVMITCDVQGPRLKASREALKSFNLDGVLEVRQFEPDPEDKIRGCYMSHVTVLEEAEQTLGQGGKEDYIVLVVEDNIGVTGAASSPEMPDVIKDVLSYAKSDRPWDVIHLGYIMYVPGLSVLRVPDDGTQDGSVGGGLLRHVVQVRVTNAQSALGNTAYLISKRGVDAVLREHRKNGFRVPIPDLMAEIFPESRFAAYPMPFHRSPKIRSIVNPQFDDLRQIMFRPSWITFWEQILVTTGLSTSVVFPSLIAFVVVLFLVSSAQAATAAWQLATSPQDFDGNVALIVLETLVSAFSLAFILYGASLAPKPPPEQAKQEG